MIRPLWWWIFTPLRSWKNQLIFGRMWYEEKKYYTQLWLPWAEIWWKVWMKVLVKRAPVPVTKSSHNWHNQTVGKRKRRSELEGPEKFTPGRISRHSQNWASLKKRPPHQVKFELIQLNQLLVLESSWEYVWVKILHNETIHLSARNLVRQKSLISLHNRQLEE